MKRIPSKLFGKDHWSLLAYVGCRVVDNRGTLNKDHMRTHPERHLAGMCGKHPCSQTHKWNPEHGTRLAGYFDDRKNPALFLEEHDDWDCLEDLEDAGMLKIGGSGLNPVVRLTKFGRNVETQIREYKADGGNFADFHRIVELFRAKIGLGLNNTERENEINRFGS